MEIDAQSIRTGNKPVLLFPSQTTDRLIWSQTQVALRLTHCCQTSQHLLPRALNGKMIGDLQGGGGQSGMCFISMTGVCRETITVAL